MSTEPNSQQRTVRSRIARGNLAAASIGFASALVLVAGLQARPGGNDDSNAVGTTQNTVATQPEFAGLAETLLDETLLDETASDKTPVGDDMSAMDREAMTASPSMTAGPRVAVEDEPSPAVVLASVAVPEAPSAPRCQALAEELWQREDAGEIVYEEYVELSEEEYENALLSLPVPRSDIAASGDRPTFDRFGDGYDVSDVPNGRLDEVVGRCWELGLID